MVGDLSAHVVGARVGEAGVETVRRRVTLSNTAMTSVVAVIVHGDGDDVRIKMRVGARRDKGQFDVLVR